MAGRLFDRDNYGDAARVGKLKRLIVEAFDAMLRDAADWQQR